MQQNNIKKTVSVSIITLLVGALIAGVGVYFWQESRLKNAEDVLNEKIDKLENKISKIESTDSEKEEESPNEIVDDNEEHSSQDSFADWQLVSGGKFTYQCPTDWSQGVNKNYNGQVDLSECSKIYSGEISFDDGISIRFGYVTDEIAENYVWAGEKWADTIFNGVKDEPNAQEYENNNFSGWLSMNNQRHTLKMIARYKVSGGYYEVTADAMGDTKADSEFKQFVDDIVSTFEII